MNKSPLLLLAALLAAPIDAQESARQADPASSRETEASGGAAETNTANQAALSASATQTARIAQDRETNARNQAAYAQAQAYYARSVSNYETEKAAVARKTADDAEAYRQRLAGWQEEAEQRRHPVRKSAAVDEKPRSRIVCAFEKPTGSNAPVRICRERDE